MDTNTPIPSKIIRRLIPLERVLERPGFNCRFSMANIEELAKSIGHPEVGLLFPPLVVVAEDRAPLSSSQRFYYVVHGHRRVAAVRSLGWKKCTFLVAEGLKLSDQYILNLAENARDNLTPAEVAERCCMIVDKLPTTQRAEMTDELAEKMGYSKSHLRTLMRLRRNLHPELWSMMVSTGHRAPIGALMTIVAKTPAEQITIWARIHAAVMEEAPTSKGKKEKSPTYTWRARAAAFLETAPPSGETADFVRGVRWAVERLRGNKG